MFTIVTGAPGASKTLNTIKRFKDVTDRPVYHRGIKGLTLNWIELSEEDAVNFHNVCPDGSLVIIDEAQQIFPTAGAGSRVPDALKFLETHRHRGFDIVFISQHPMLLHSHARKICNEHYHYSRSFGTNKPYEYHSGSGFVNPQDQRELMTTCTRKKVKIDPEIFDLYKSAEVHTHKKRTPTKVYFLYAALFSIFLFGFFGFRWWSGVVSGSDQGLGSTQEPSVVSSGSTNDFIPVRYSQDEPLDWVELLTPQIDGLPYTAPIYEEEASKPKSIPRIAGCIRSKSRKTCDCFTQQATKISGISQSFCEKFVQDGMFDHLISDSTVEGERGKGDRARAPAPAQPHHQPVQQVQESPRVSSRSSSGQFWQLR